LAGNRFGSGQPIVPGHSSGRDDTARSLAQEVAGKNPPAVPVGSILLACTAQTNPARKASQTRQLIVAHRPGVVYFFVELDPVIALKVTDPAQADRSLPASRVGEMKIPFQVNAVFAGELIEVFEAAIAEVVAQPAEVILELDQSANFTRGIAKQDPIGVEFAQAARIHLPRLLKKVPESIRQGGV